MLFRSYNISGNYEESNLVIAEHIVELFTQSTDRLQDYMDLSVTRPGQDVRYSINDDKLRALGWQPQADFEEELAFIVEYYKQNFVW